VAESRRARLMEVVHSCRPIRFEDESEGQFYDNSVYPVLDKQGRVDQVAIFASDITDYKLAKASVEERTAELVESEEKYRTLVENVPLVVYRMRSGGEILFINQFVEVVFGFSPSEIVTNPGLWDLSIHNEDRERVGEFRRSSFLEGSELIAEYRIRHKDGHIVYVMDHAIPLRDHEERVVSIDGILMDVTGRVRIQEKLLRTEGLKTISEVSARLAHEIRNPLVSAGGFARRLLSSMNPDDPNRAKVEIILEEVVRLEMILRMILNYLQPVELHRSPNDANELIQAALYAVSTEIKERDVLVDLRLSPLPEKINVDGAQFERAIEVLLRNALSQMQQGATLSIATTTSDGTFKLCIDYPAQHIARDDVKHFFYPFTLSRAPFDHVDLPMSKIIIEKHGGAIEVNLERRGKLAIEITLPLRAPS